MEKFKALNWWENLFETFFPGRCHLCGGWKLWGKRPHNKCMDREAYYENAGGMS